MFKEESARQIFEPKPDTSNSPKSEQNEGELDETKKRGSAKIYPFVKPGEQKKEEVANEGFVYQDITLFLKGQIVGRYYRGFPTKVIPKDVGKYEILEKMSTGKIVSTILEVDEIRFGDGNFRK